MTKLSTFIKRQYDTYKAQQFDIQWNLYKTALLDGITGNRRINYDTLMDNQLNQLQLQEKEIPTKSSHRSWVVEAICNIIDSPQPLYITQDFMFKLTKMVLDRLAHWDIVGVQAMTGPASLVYSLQFKSTPNEAGDNTVTLNVVYQAVSARLHKLRTTMTTEAMQDMCALLESGSDVIHQMADAISAEINEELIRDLVDVSEHVVVDLADPMTVADLMDTSPTTPICIDHKPSKMVLNITRIANQIGQETQRGCGNFVIVDTITACLLKNVQGVEMFNDVDPALIHTGKLVQIGVINGTIKLYSIVAGLPMDTALVGYKGGSGEIDTAYIYSPYVTLISRLGIDPKTYETRNQLAIRYGKVITSGDHLLGPNYYKTITFTNII
jgi:hypothetical protein